MMYIYNSHCIKSTHSYISSLPRIENKQKLFSINFLQQYLHVNRIDNSYGNVSFEEMYEFFQA